VSDTTRNRMTVPRFVAAKAEGRPLVVLTAYDAPGAAAAEEAGVDALLVGDSVANVLLGHETTLGVGMGEMMHHLCAVSRARRRALLIGDMPWMSYHLAPEQAARNAARMIREGGADAVKLEGGANRIDAIRAILDAEIPVMGHIGLTPQSVLRLGGYRVQGRDEAGAERLVDEARALAAAGVFALVLEGMPAPLAERITSEVEVPTIGIGAGAGCDGQVLVFHDLLGMSPVAPPKFVRRYARIYEQQVEAIRRWAADVRERDFPGDDETYH